MLRVSQYLKYQETIAQQHNYEDTENMNQFDNDKDVDLKHIQQACAILHEHYETVQIFITHTDDTGHNTKHAHYGVGNWFARYGYVKAFIADNEREFMGTTSGKEEKKPDDLKEWE